MKGDKWFCFAGNLDGSLSSIFWFYNMFVGVFLFKIKINFLYSIRLWFILLLHLDRVEVAGLRPVGIKEMKSHKSLRYKALTYLLVQKLRVDRVVETKDWLLNHPPKWWERSQKWFKSQTKLEESIDPRSNFQICSNRWMTDCFIIRSTGF